MSRAHITLITVLVATVALLAIASSVLGQSPADDVEIVGEISSLEGQTAITLNGLRVNIARAQLYGPLNVGAAVKVEGTLQSDGTILAREVKAAQDDGLLPGEIETVGNLLTLSATTATLNGFTFDIATAEVEPALTAGTLVKVHARLGDGGVWRAREIERFAPAGWQLPPGHVAIAAGAECSQCHSDGRQGTAPTGLVGRDDDGLELIGTLDEIGTGYVVVGGQRYDTTGAEMKGALVAGALVKLEMTRLPSGALVVREFKSTMFGDDDDEWDDWDDDDDDTCEFEVEVRSASLRSGPGTGYGVIGSAAEDDEFRVLAVDASGSWVQVATRTGPAWLALSAGELDDCDGLSASGSRSRSDDDDHDDDGDDDDDHEDRDDD